MPVSKKQREARRMKVKLLLAKGLSTRQIASELECSPRTINSDIQKMQKEASGTTSKELHRLRQGIKYCDKHIRRILKKKDVNTAERNLLTSLQKQRSDYQRLYEEEKLRLATFDEQLRAMSAEDEKAVAQAECEGTEVLSKEVKLRGGLTVEEWDQFQNVFSRGDMNSGKPHDWHTHWHFPIRKSLWNAWEQWCEYQNKAVQRTVKRINAENDIKLIFRPLTPQAWLRQLMAYLMTGKFELGISKEGEAQLRLNWLYSEQRDKYLYEPYYDCIEGGVE